MTQVVIENIDKSFPARQSERAAVPVTTDPLLTQVETTPLAKSQPTDRHSEVSVLRRINLTVAAGEFMVLVGPSGCGKSTLLRLIAGLEEITGGNVWLGDRLVNNLPPKQRDMAMVFQNYALYPHMTVYDNLAFGLRRTGKSAGKASVTAGLENLLVGITRSLPKGLRYLTKQERVVDQRVRNVAALLQIQPLLNRLPKQLSGGQKQRIALGRAIARNPQVFLMDEPLSNLDAKLRAETRAQIVKLQRQLGTTTIYVTHDQTEAMTMGDRIAVMNQGQIQQVAHPIEIYNYPATRFVAEFIGSPPMNFLRVQFQAPLLITHSHFRFTLPDAWATSLQKYDGQALILGIRPEHLCLSVAAPQNLLVQVELVEALGNDTYLSVRLVEGETAHASVNLTVPLLQVRISPDRVVSVGEQVWLSLTPEKIHLFDPETDTAIRPKVM